jgi:hypothetical protein
MQSGHTTRVVNKRVSEFDVYIGRGSKWGNPFRIGDHGDRDQVIAEYQRYICLRPNLIAALGELRGKRLGCFCAPKPCHGDVLVDLVRMMDAEGLDAVMEWARDERIATALSATGGFEPPLGPGE